ncbi:acyl carrier protein [Pseudophaeobacter sp.]|uniref:acyl carrier protein n=1 Tax=Pseudophaeobacter sp. TaxID=1971739 RepID=UPI003296F1BB
MNTDELERILTEELYRIAPDIDLAEIDRSADLREEFDIDSMDFLTLVTALGHRFELEMPEADYPKMQSFNAILAYLKSKVG